MGLLIVFGWMIIGLLFLMNRSGKLRESELENRMMQSYIASMEELYDVMKARTLSVRKYRHDLAKHIRTLEALTDRQHTSDGALEYANDLRKMYEQMKSEEFCTDEIVNAVLAVKKRQCEEGSIPFSVSVLDGAYHFIDDIDMVSLLQNLLDNALEAQGRITSEEKRGIAISMESRDDCVVMEVSNRIAGKEKMDFRSRKGNPQEHGLGIRIIDQVTAKYHGRRECFLKDGVFVCRIILRKHAGSEKTAADETAL